jgi:hypothetical protein
MVVKWGGFSLEEDKLAQSIRHTTAKIESSSGGLKIRPT